MFQIQDATYAARCTPAKCHAADGASCGHRELHTGSGARPSDLMSIRTRLFASLRLQHNLGSISVQGSAVLGPSS